MIGLSQFEQVFYFRSLQNLEQECARIENVAINKYASRYALSDLQNNTHTTPSTCTDIIRLDTDIAGEYRPCLPGTFQLNVVSNTVQFVLLGQFF